LLAAGHVRADDISGTYQGKAPAADASRRVFTLQLVQDGSAVFNTLYLGRDNTTQRGHWTLNRSEVLLTFEATEPNRPLRPITFRYRYRDHVLSPLHWDPNEWGRKGPPALYRSETRKKL
jgi:hypothetical protein